MVRREVLETAVLSRTKNSLLSPTNIQKLVREVNREIGKRSSAVATRAKELDREITQVLSRLGRYYEAFESGTLSAEDLGPRVAELNSQRDELEVSKTNTQQDRSVPKISKALVRHHVEDLKTLL